jgi:hypothetical protein
MVGRSVGETVRGMGVFWHEDWGGWGYGGRNEQPQAGQPLTHVTEAC